MKVYITENKEAAVTTVEITCREVGNEVERLKRYIEDYDSRLKGKSQGEAIYVKASDVLYFESVDNRTFMYTADSVLEVEKKLYELEDFLNNKDFFRCSKSVIVNVNAIKSLKPEVTRNILAKLVNDEIITISRRYVKGFRALIER
ncbi:MAG: LytTR family transcriptional regulator [Lachnospiraceae bacterium]|nr:LytTR family transcriptional regulator [Lachnospiraceae bacterium]